MQDYDKAQVIIHKNMEYEKEQIHEQFKSINVPVYLHLRLCETIEQAMFAAPNKKEAEELVLEALKDSLAKWSENGAGLLYGLDWLGEQGEKNKENLEQLMGELRAD